MDKGKINAILKECESLTAIERAFLAKQLIKWGASDMRVQANAINNLKIELNFEKEISNGLRATIADFNAKKARGILKNAEQKLKESGGLGIVENENNDTKTSTCTTGTITAKILFNT